AEVAEAGARGLLTAGLSAVHLVGVDADGLARLARKGCAAVWCPTSNAFLYGATAPRALFGSGIPLLLGTDALVSGAGTLLDELAAARATRLVSDARLEAAVSTVAARRLGLPAPDRSGFEDAVADALASCDTRDDASLRLLWTAGREDAGEPVGLVLVSTLSPDLDALRARGLRLAVVRWAPGALAGAKSTSYAENMAARDAAVRAGADDALFVSPDDVVLEAPTSNVWIREGGTVITPPLELPLLAGVTRAALLELAPSAGYEAREGSFPLARLLAADEVFYSSSLREVTPVVAVDGAPVAGGAPGPAAAALQRALRDAASG
ncbi:MAG TPA: aminotransferase class IV, partial [Gaiellaceae bacterium]|nr:aminotransferase class IV [Gaiellaceae bacterium]